MSVVREKIMHYSDVYTAACAWSYWKTTYDYLRKVDSPDSSEVEFAKRKLHEAEQELLQACYRPLSYYSR